MTSAGPGTPRPAEPAPEPSPEALAARPREHLANERTVLAWARTAITFEALGFGVSRFDLFLRQSEQQSSARPVLSAVIGIVFVVAGLAAAAMGAIRYLQVRRQIEAGRFEARAWPHVVVLAMMGVLGVGLIVYLAVEGR